MSSDYKYSSLLHLINDFDYRTLKTGEDLIVIRKNYE
jgi:hypothetical protein